ncbi:hypothetical protein [Nocardioides sp. LHG3406-4]|uniref:hypothetical protein n=1 Tax=Nocardioides sp. LHG3406-4 TaxID=2804575 RepID=UPI003CF81910
MRSMQTGVGSAKSFARELESADSRMANLVQSGLALAPALTPLGAAATPAIAGITTALGFTVAAAGTAVLAFQGVGDTLKALNDFQIDPSSENLEKLNEKLDALGPAGEVFVRQLQAMRPELQDLQDIAQQELFPGMTDGLQELLELGPQAEDVIGSLASTMGDLFAEAGDNLNDERWIEFFEYLDREARPVLTATAKSVGNFAEGITNLVMATDPMSDDFLSGLLDRSREFVEWSDRLDSTEGFQNFLDYVSDNGPQAMDTLGALGGALVSVVQATAPVGAVVLPILEDLADVFAAFMGTPVGPVIVAAAAAVGTLGRSMALLSAVGLRGEKGGLNSDSMIGRALGLAELKSVPETYRQVAAAQTQLKASQDALATSAVKARDAQFALIPTADKRSAITEYSAAQRKVAAASEEVAKAEAKRTAALRASAAQMGKSLAVAGGFAAVTSGLTDDLGLSNAALGAMAGSMLGGWGAAVGGGVGLLVDFGNAGDDVAEMMKRLDKSVDGNVATLEQQRANLKETRAQLVALQDAAYNPSFGQGLKNAFSPDFWAELVQHAHDGSELFGDELEAWNEQTNQLVESEDALYGLGRALDMVFQKNDNGSVAFAIEDLEAVANRAQPALDALGLSIDEISKMDPAGQQAAADAIRDWLLNADTARGRTEALAGAFRGLDDEMLSTSEAAFDMKNSLDALLGPGLNVSAATDEWRAGLRHLNADLEKNTGSLFANTDAADQNREVIRDKVGNLRDMLVAEAEAGAGSARLARLLKEGRAALIDVGAAAGLSRRELNAYANQLGLTPKMVHTIIEAQTANAEADVERVRARLDKLNAMKPSPKVDAQIEAAEAKLKRLLALLDAADNDRETTITTRMQTIYTSSGGGGTVGRGESKAEGGKITGPGSGTSDDVPIWASNGEHMWTAREVANAGGHAAVEAIRAKYRYANGGRVGATPNAGNADERLAVLQAEQRIRELVKSLNADGKDRLKGLNRQVAEAELKAAKAALRTAEEGLGATAAAKADEAAQAERDRRQGIEDGRATAHEKRRQDETDAFVAMLDGQQKAVDQFIHAAEEQKSAAEAIRDGVLQSMKQLGEAATRGFQSELFPARTGNLWSPGGGGTGWRGALGRDNAGLEERQQLIAQLSGSGMSKEAIAALLTEGNNANIADILKRGEGAEFSAMFTRRQELIAETASQAGQLVYGGELAAANADVGRIEAQLVILNQQMELLNGLRPITVNEAISARATADEVSRRLAMAGGV